MSRRRQIYEGKAKILYEGPEPGTIIQYFKDDATAFNAQKKGTINGKGVINNRISEYVFTRLNHIGIPTHFIRRLNMREQLVRQVEIVPIEVVVRNVAAGSISKRLGIPEGRAGITARMDIAFLGNPPIPVQVQGHAGIRYDDQAKAFFLENPVAEAVESVALRREFEPQVRRAVSQLIAAYFRDRPVYVLRENGSAQESTARWLLRSVRIETGRVVATLSPF